MFALLMGLKTISPDRLQRMRQEQPVTVIDVNSPQSWTKAHVPGALNLDPAGFRPKPGLERRGATGGAHRLESAHYSDRGAL
jgi:rhodanese-related sulfurtransferase